MVFLENWKRLEDFFFEISSFLGNRGNDIFQKFSSSLFQYSERTIASTETNYTSAESPGFQLLFDTLKVGVALSGGRHALSPQKAYFVEFYGRGMGFWLLAFSEISRTQFLSYSHFQGVKLKLRSRAFFWCIVCYSTSIEFFQILNSKIFRNWLLHPVWKFVNRRLTSNSYRNKFFRIIYFCCCSLRSINEYWFHFRFC